MACCYCDKCGKHFRRPKIGPRKVLKSGGIFRPTIYELHPYETFSEYTTRVCYYYFVHDYFCPNCGRKVSESDKMWAKEFGEIASKSDITRYFNYCQTHNCVCYGDYRYPGEEY